MEYEPTVTVAACYGGYLVTRLVAGEDGQFHEQRVCLSIEEVLRAVGQALADADVCESARDEAQAIIARLRAKNQ